MDNMGKNLLFFLVLFSYSIPALAAFDNCGSSAKTISMGHASVALGDEASVVSSNPAGLGFFDRIGFQTSLSRLFDLDELSEKEFHLVYP